MCVCGGGGGGCVCCVCCEYNVSTKEAKLAWEVAMYCCCQVREGGKEG